MRIFRRFLDLFFPGDCDLCGRRIRENDFVQLCGECAAKLTLPSDLGICEKCAHPLASGACPSCKGEGLGFHRAQTLFLNQNQGQAFLYDYKFHKRRSSISVLAERSLKDHLDYFRSFDGLVPVPIAGLDLFEREFCPVTEPVKRIAKKSGVPWHSAFRRIPGSKTQHFEKLEDRLAGAYAKYQLKKNYIGAFAGKRVLLVDDILTTGATLQALTRHIRENGGAAEISAFTFARSVLGSGTATGSPPWTHGRAVSDANDQPWTHGRGVSNANDQPSSKPFIP